MSQEHQLINHVLRRLAMQRSQAQRLDGDQLPQALASLAASNQDALIEVEVLGGQVGRVLLQNGRLVFAQRGNDLGLTAWEQLRRGSVKLRIILLDKVRSALACAVVDGQRVPVPPFNAGGLTPFLAQQRAAGFSGVVMSERGLELSVWLLANGQLVGDAEPSSEVSSERVNQIAWQTRLLPELAGNGSSTLLANSATRQIASPQPVVTVDRAPVQPAAQEPTTVPLQPPWGESEAVDPWPVFTLLLQQHLGTRSGRVLGLMRQEYAGLQGQALIERMAQQIERVAGGGVARDFRQKF